MLHGLRTRVDVVGRHAQALCQIQLPKAVQTHYPATFTAAQFSQCISAAVLHNEQSALQIS